MTMRRLLLLPGLLSDAGLWEGVCGSLPPTVRVAVADYEALRSIPAMAHSAWAHLPDGRYWLAGHALGGRVAMEMLRQAPGRIAGLALVGTGSMDLPTGERGIAEHTRWLELLESARRRGMREAGRAWAQDRVHPQQLDTPLFQSILRMVERQTPDRFAAQVHALLARPDVTPLLGHIACPTVLICGRQDGQTPVAEHEQLAARIAGAILGIVEGAGHLLPMEQPEATAGVLSTWLGLDAAPPSPPPPGTCLH